MKIPGGLPDMDGAPSPMNVIMKVFKVPLFLLLGSSIVSLICFLVFIMSPYGMISTSYQAKALAWKASSTSSILENTYFGFKIMPVVDSSRLRDQFELKWLDYEVDHKDYSRKAHVDMGYSSSYFFFNNTVK
jgi:hypothetical protein